MSNVWMRVRHTRGIEGEREKGRDKRERGGEGEREGEREREREGERREGPEKLCVATSEAIANCFQSFGRRFQP